ncbi:hypothetical protein AB0J83_12100 [Actinoplanes sp. NPDC049596]|uniref:hypothetical protein n=1 Tax=unclassified Actinoplanes TaxID=2626549 RepID=UPI00343BF6D0
MAPVPAGPPVAHRFEPAAVAPGPRLSRKGRRLAAAGAAVVLAAVALVVVWPDPSPAGTVEDYFDHLGAGDTEAALALVDTDRMFSLDGMPLLVPAALADSGNRPGDVEVTASEPYAGDSRYTVVTASYRVGDQAVEQNFAVVETGDDETPYRLEQPFVRLTVALPNGLDVTVNGVTVDPATAAGTTFAFPGLYRAATSGNVIFAGAERAATYSTGTQGVAAEIDLTRLDLAPGVRDGVQKAADSFLDANCVNPSYGAQCPLQAPSMSWSQTTTWTITAYPQIQVTADDQGQAPVRFTTGTAGSADYTITYSDFGGAQRTETGTVPIDLSGRAGLGDDGAIAVALGY